MKKNILLLDTSFSAKPIYDFLVLTGAEVFVIGGNQNDTLAKSVKNYIYLDYSKIDDVKSLIKSLSIDYIVPGGNDFSYKICSELNAKNDFYNIDSIEVNETINNKEKFKKFASNINLHIPRIIELEQIKDFLPVIIKPVDAYSGHGMTVIYKTDNVKIQNAIKLAEKFSKSQNYLIEEYVKGQLYSHSAFIVNGEIIIDFIVEEHCIVNQYVVDTSRVNFDFDQKIMDQIRKDISRMVKELNLVDGLVHTQFICDGTSFWIIEVTRRCPGDLYSQLIELSTGFNYAKAYSQPFINQKINLSNNLLIKGHALRHTISQAKESYFSSIKFNKSVQIEKLLPLCIAGDKIKASPFSRIGLLFLTTDSEKELMNLYKITLNRKLYSIL